MSTAARPRRHTDGRIGSGTTRWTPDGAEQPDRAEPLGDAQGQRSQCAA